MAAIFINKVMFMGDEGMRKDDDECRKFSGPLLLFEL